MNHALETRFKPETTPGVKASHPLDPLTMEELSSVADLLRKDKGLGATCRFPYLQLEEPPKQEVLAFKIGDAFSRRAFAVVLDKATGAIHEATVDLVTQQVSRWEPLDPEVTGQPAIMIEEFFSCVDIVQADLGFIDAVKRRGLTDADIETIQIDPWRGLCA
jgi:primary-amine oxidase